MWILRWLLSREYRERRRWVKIKRRIGRKHRLFNRNLTRNMLLLSLAETRPLPSPSKEIRIIQYHDPNLTH